MDDGLTATIREAMPLAAHLQVDITDDANRLVSRTLETQTVISS